MVWDKERGCEGRVHPSGVVEPNNIEAVKMEVKKGSVVCKIGCLNVRGLNNSFIHNVLFRNWYITGLKFKSRSYSTNLKNNHNINIMAVQFSEKGLLGENTVVSFEPQCLRHQYKYIIILYYY